MFDYNRITRVAASAAAALILSTLSIAAAVGPARSAETAPIVVAVASQGAALHG